MTQSRQAVAYLVLVFLLGAALGAGGYYWYDSVQHERAAKEKKKKKDETESAVEWLTKELECTKEQKAELEAILDATREAYDSLWDEVEPKFQAARHDGRDRIRAILNEEQRARFEKLVRSIDEKESKEEGWKKEEEGSAEK